MRRFSALALVLVMLVSLAGCGFSNGSVSEKNNSSDASSPAVPAAVDNAPDSIVKQTQNTTATHEPVKVPCSDDIDALNLESNIVVPETEEYISVYEDMFILPAAASVFSNPRTDKGIEICGLHAGDVVTVAAKRDTVGFVLYDDSDENRRGGWVSLNTLSYNDPLEERHATSAPDMSGVPSQKDIDNLGQTKSINLPEEDEYIACYDRQYVVTATAEVLARTEKKIASTECSLVSGTEVNVIALRDTTACIIFESDMGTKAGWISYSALGYNDPGSDLRAVSAKTYSGTPGISDITALGLEKSMTLPDESSYVTAYDRMYIVTSKANLLTFTDKDRAHIGCCPVSGSEVCVIAKQNSMICVLCETDQGTKAGWIANTALGYNMPNENGRVTESPDFTGKPGIDTIRSLGLDNSMTLPEEYEYATGFNKMHIGSNLTNVLSYTDAKMSHVVCDLYPGSEVTVLAQRDKIVCIVFECDAGTKAGWVSQDNLTYRDINSIQKITEAAEPSGTPDPNDIEKLGLDNSMTMPEKESYLAKYKKMYVSPATAQIYSYYGGRNNMQVCTLLRNSVVIKIAEQEKSACILFECDEGLKAGWINKEHLSETKLK